MQPNIESLLSVGIPLHALLFVKNIIYDARHKPKAIIDFAIIDSETEISKEASDNPVIVYSISEGEATG